MLSNLKITIYNPAGIVLTTLLPVDFEAVTRETSLNSDGFCEFVCRADNPKLTIENVSIYNRIKIYEGSQCVFYGYINDNVYDLNTVRVRGVSLSSLLKDRLMTAYTGGSSFVSAITQVINSMNALSDTGITIGTIDMLGIPAKSYTASDTVDYVIKDLAGSFQFYVDTDGKVNIAEFLGIDKSNSVTFRYDLRQIENSNLLNFNVRENGQNILTRIFARDVLANYVFVDNATLQAKYGVIEAPKTYYSVTGTPALTTECAKDFQGSTFTPDITLSPKVEDNFDVGDFVAVKIYNKFVNINTKYQVLTKTVTYVGKQKEIKVKLNDNTKDLLDFIKDQDKRITQLQNI